MVVSLHWNVPGLAQEIQHLGIRCRVEVAGQDDRYRLVFENRHDSLCLRQPFLRGPIQMDPHENDLGARGAADADPARKGGPRFFPVRQPVVGDFFERVSGQQRHAVVTAAVLHEQTERMVHTGQLAESLRLIDAIGTGRLVVDLLQGDQVGVERADDAGGTLQVYLAIHALAVLDVVRQHPDPDSLSVALRRDGRGRSNERDEKRDGRDSPQAAQAGLHVLRSSSVS